MPYLTLTELSSKHTTNRNIIHKSVNQAAFGIEGTNQHLHTVMIHDPDMTTTISRETRLVM